MTKLDFDYRSLSRIFGEQIDYTLSDEQKRAAVAAMRTPAMQARLKEETIQEQFAFARVRANWVGSR